jgi:hypothetical protein
MQSWRNTACENYNDVEATRAARRLVYLVAVSNITTRNLIGRLPDKVLQHNTSLSRRRVSQASVSCVSRHRGYHFLTRGIHDDDDPRCNMCDVPTRVFILGRWLEFGAETRACVWIHMTVFSVVTTLHEKGIAFHDDMQKLPDSRNRCPFCSPKR